MSLRGMSVGGVDPSILRELSGVYKPFVKAFKELISNAYDADADNVAIEFADDFSSVSVSDDGSGMTPFDFRTDFTRIGGSSRRWNRGTTTKGRARIGSKGIGFLALARYCDSMEVTSYRRKTQKIKQTVETKTSFDLKALLGVPMDSKLLKEVVSCDARRATGRKGQLKEGKDFKVDYSRQRISFTKDIGEVDITVSIDCKQLAFRSVLDFKRLLKLADEADLEKLDDFTSIELIKPAKGQKPGTIITVCNLKPFVRNDLRSERKKGFVRNVASWSGLERFSWSMSRCTPVEYEEPTAEQRKIVRSLFKPDWDTLNSLSVSHGKETQQLKRPTYLVQEVGSIRPDISSCPSIGCHKLAGFTKSHRL